jgi:hypothetical protein
MILGSFCDRFGMDSFRMNLGSFWECFGIVLELFFIGFTITRIEAARSAAENSSIYIYISEIGGNEALAEPNREIGFGFVSCSCRACVRACETVWVREGGVPGGSDGEKSDSSVGCFFCVFAAIRKGFKEFSQMLLLYARVLRTHP